MRIKIFSSGSAGNSALLEINNKKILIDVGISKKDLETNLYSMNIGIDDLDYLFITHEHIDHIRSFQSMLKSKKLKIVMSKGTFAYISKYYSSKPQALKGITEFLRTERLILVEKNSDDIYYPLLNLDGLKIQILPLFHDAIEPIGFVFYDDKKKLTYITDTGYVHEGLFDIIRNSDIFVLESNHDPELLMASSRPYPLKIRIIGNHGHMSNEESMVVLAECMGENTKYVLHAHVSQECNLNVIIEGKRKEVFSKYNIDRKDIEFNILGLSPSKVYEV